MAFDSIAQNVTNTPRATDPRFADRPPLRPHDLQSIWAPVDPETGEVSDKVSDLRTLDYSVGKTGAGFHNSIDRILDGIHGRENVGYGVLEGYVFIGLGIKEREAGQLGTLTVPTPSAPAEVTQAPEADDQPEA